MTSNTPSRPTLRLVGEAEDFHQGAWRADGTLVLTHHATMPDRCVVCNAPAEGFTLKKTLFWHTPLLLPLLIVVPPLGLIGYAGLAFFLKKTMPLEMPLCARHRRRRQLMGVTGLLLLPAFPIFALVGLSMSEPTLLLPGLILSLIGAVVLIVGRNELWPARITDDHAFIRGANREWLSTLPEWTGEDD
ncbi:MAG: hypothetical protein AAFV53_02365 [Myxococcota bacterium]